MNSIEHQDITLSFFSYSHLPEDLQKVSKPFGVLAENIVRTIETGNQRSNALQRLLEAKDAAVRAALIPGA